MSELVLVVDDSLTVRMDLAECLEQSGFRTHLCANAAAAREALLGDLPALIILDVVLPDADGVELLKEIRESSGASLPVMLLSSEAEVADRIRGLTRGADEYVRKPYDQHYVVARARELVQLRRTEPQGAGSYVLVIDDSPTYRWALEEALREAGHRVVCAESGEEGMRLAADIRPVAIVIDNLLPGMDGASVVRGVRLDAALRGTPCLLLTASEDHGAEIRALEAGADAFVRKNEDLPVIMARFKAMLRQAGAANDGFRSTSLHGPKRILAVDDSETYLQGITETMRGEGYDVVLARSGAVAIEMLQVQTVDCILLDLAMPGMGGHETCRKIKSMAKAQDVPIILLTWLDDRQSMIDGLEAGADDYVSKASDAEVIKARVRTQIRRRQFEDENRLIREERLRMELEAAEALASRTLAETRAAHAEELERKNKELEAFSYSVAHDLRAPLRSIDGFSRMLLEECGPQLEPIALQHLQTVRRATQRMGELIHDILQLSRIGYGDLDRTSFDLTAMVRSVASELAGKHPERTVELQVEDGLCALAEPRLVKIVLENLIGNAWKFTARVEHARIQFGTRLEGAGRAYFVTDNGAGFDPALAEKLFQPFQRLHREAEFPGTGIGLATVHRVIDRHRGRAWATGSVGAGATICFTLGEPAATSLPSAVVPRR